MGRTGDRRDRRTGNAVEAGRIIIRTSLGGGTAVAKSKIKESERLGEGARRRHCGAEGRCRNLKGTESELQRPVNRVGRARLG